MIVVCVFDNPMTMCRESWVNGRLTAHISCMLMYTREFDGFPSMPFQLNVGKEFIPAKVYGDNAALNVAMEQDHGKD